MKNHNEIICIFCPEPVGDDPPNEHIFPQNIYGIWITHDVCGKCNSQFGSKVDTQLLQYPPVVEAVDKLNLSKPLETMLRQAKITDVSDKKRMLQYRKGRVRVIPRKLDGRLEYSEEDGVTHLRNQLRKEKIGKDELERIIGEAREKIDKLQPGQSVDIAEHTIIKRHGEQVDIVYKTAVNPPYRPVAKIVLEFLFFCFPSGSNIIDTVRSDILRQIAIGNTDVESNIILPLVSDVEPKPFHKITMERFGDSLLMWLTFFGRRLFFIDCGKISGNPFAVLSNTVDPVGLFAINDCDITQKERQYAGIIYYQGDERKIEYFGE